MLTILVGLFPAMLDLQWFRELKTADAIFSRHELTARASCRCGATCGARAARTGCVVAASRKERQGWFAFFVFARISGWKREKATTKAPRTPRMHQGKYHGAHGRTRIEGSMGWTNWYLTGFARLTGLVGPSVLFGAAGPKRGPSGVRGAVDILEKVGPMRMCVVRVAAKRRGNSNAA